MRPGNGVVISNTRWWCNGTLGRNTLVGPGYGNFDFGPHKKFKVTEGSSLQLQANAFNVFNRANFGLPVGNLNSPQAGRSTSTVGGPALSNLPLDSTFEVMEPKGFQRGGPAAPLFCACDTPKQVRPATTSERPPAG